MECADFFESMKEHDMVLILWRKKTQKFYKELRVEIMKHKHVSFPFLPNSALRSIMHVH